ncbi:MAG: biotin transporter BioY, partial [Clostridiales bacterium]|nr:biotin transporter BioY [Clostridiales bacterium]
MSVETTNAASSARTNRARIRDLTLVALFAALMAICSWISIPATVPFTLQTFGVFIAVGLLGGKRGTLSVLVYILLG